MIKFEISAPGKIILFGEHSVVYGKKAVAASLDRRTVCKFYKLSSLEPWIYLRMPNVDLLKKVQLHQVQEFFIDSDFPKLRDVGHDKFYQRVQKFVEIIGFDDQRQRFSLECFFYALIQIVQEEGLELKGFGVDVKSELPIGAGVGSSASFSSCLVAGFLRFSLLQKNTRDDKFSTDDLSKISKYAFNCEKIMHGTPSGIDNSICIFGSVIEFQKGKELNFVPLGSRSLKIILVDTKVDRSTKLMVKKLADLTAKYPEIFHKVLDAMDEVSKRVVVIIDRIQKLSEDENDEFLEAYKELSVLVNVNQGLLTTCQVSHSSLDLICATAKKHEFSAKLTGAGGGGFAYVLVPPDVSENKITNLISELIENNFSVIETYLGGSGIEIHS